MFEQWSERRRRWFLVTFCAVAWALFANSLAMLGDPFYRGGIGSDGMHAVGVVGNIALWTAVWGACRLRLRHWAFAALCGVTVSAAVVESGLRDGAAAAIWSVNCDAGNGQACHQLATYFADGRSPLHGWLDAEPLHERACARGVRQSCAASLRARARHVPADFQRQSAGCLQSGIVSDCRRAAARLAADGDLQQMYRYLEVSCTELGDAESCGELLDSGYPRLRLEACEVLERSCRVSSSSTCTVTERRCERARSPFAGTR